MNRPTKYFSSLAAILLLLAIHSAAWAQGGLPAGQPGQTPGGPAAGGPVDDATYRQQIGYMLGQNVGRDLRQNEIECDMESFMAGVTDCVSAVRSPSGAMPKCRPAAGDSNRK